MTDETWLQLVLVVFAAEVAFLVYETLSHRGGLARMGLSAQFEPVGASVWIGVAIWVVLIASMTTIAWGVIFGIFPEPRWILERWPYPIK